MDAEAWLASERRLIDRGEWTAPKLRANAAQTRSRPFIEYATGWLEHRTLKPRTRQGYQELLGGPLAKLHKLPLNLITVHDCRDDPWREAPGRTRTREKSRAWTPALSNQALVIDRIGVLRLLLCDRTSKHDEHRQEIGCLGRGRQPEGEYSVPCERSGLEEQHQHPGCQQHGHP
jgi:hypothetical protein